MVSSVASEVIDHVIVTTGNNAPQRKAGAMPPSAIKGPLEPVQAHTNEGQLGVIDGDHRGR